MSWWIQLSTRIGAFTRSVHCRDVENDTRKTCAAPAGRTDLRRQGPLDATRTTRRQFMDAMHKEGIGIGISYEAIHLTSYFRGKGFREGQFPVSERIARETVTLPLYVEMRDSDVERVVASMKRVLRRKAA